MSRLSLCCGMNEEFCKNNVLGGFFSMLHIIWCPDHECLCYSLHPRQNTVQKGRTRQKSCIIFKRRIRNVLLFCELYTNILTLCVKLYYMCIFPEDKLEQQHALFTQYKDPCRLGPGEDKPWALGKNIHIHTSTVTWSSRNTVRHLVYCRSLCKHT